MLAEKQHQLTCNIMGTLAKLASQKLTSKCLADETLAVQCLGQISTLIQKSATHLDKNNLGEAFELELIPLYQSLAAPSNPLVVEVIEVALTLVRYRKSKLNADVRIRIAHCGNNKVVCEPALQYEQQRQLLPCLGQPSSPPEQGESGHRSAASRDPLLQDFARDLQPRHVGLCKPVLHCAFPSGGSQGLKQELRSRSAR